MSAESDWIDPCAAQAHGLTPRQCDVLEGVARGWTDALIARGLHLSTDTVNTHLRGLFRKLGTSNRAAAVAVAYDTGVLRTRAQRISQARAAGLRVAS